MASAARTVIPRPTPRTPSAPKPLAHSAPLRPAVVSLSAAELEVDPDDEAPASVPPSVPPPLPTQRCPAGATAARASSRPPPSSQTTSAAPAAASTPKWLAALPNLPVPQSSSITPPAPKSVAPAASVAAPASIAPPAPASIAPPAPVSIAPAAPIAAPTVTEAARAPRVAPGPPSIPGVSSGAEAPETAPASVVPPSSRRMLGDELASTLFEHVHGMSFLADALEAARYALVVLAETIPCRASLVHFFDVTRHEFIVVDARGEAADDMRLKRHSVTDPLLRVAMPLGGAFFWNDLTNAPARSVARFASLGQVRRALVCPVVSGGRWLAAIELIDPLDGENFDSPDEGAAAYVAKHLAEFLGAHGVIVDLATIARFAFDEE